MRFLYTKDEKIKDVLISSGYKLMFKSGDIWYFRNNKSLMFSLSDEDKEKVKTTDMLLF